MLKIKIVSAAFCALLLMNGCGGEKSPETTQSAPTRAELSFGGPESKDSHTIFIEIDSPEEIKTLAGLSEGVASENLKCGYDGHVKFFAGDQKTLEGDFNLSPECMTFSFLQGEEVKSVKLTEASVKFLQDKRDAAVKKQFAGGKWMLGKWEIVAAGSLSYEEWNPSGENELAGFAFVMQKKDTVFQETMNIITRGNEVFYVVKPGKNEPVEFKLTFSGANYAVFENEENDFPKVITYQTVQDTGLLAVIEGPDAREKWVQEKFPYRRAK